MRSTIDVHLIEGDILATQCDLACFKHAQSFYGADEAAVSAIATRTGASWATFEISVGEVKVFDTASSAPIDSARCATTSCASSRAACSGTDRPRRT